MDFFSQEIILGLTVQEFLLHLLNFVILFVALFFLLYKPVKKFMQKRKEDYEDAEKKYNDAKKYASEVESEAEKTINDAKEAAVLIAEEAQKQAMEQRTLILSDAQEEADRILSDARKEADDVVAGSKEAMYIAAKDMAYDVAEKLIARDLKTEDNDVFIDAILENAKKKDVQDA